MLASRIVLCLSENLSLWKEKERKYHDVIYNVFNSNETKTNKKKRERKNLDCRKCAPWRDERVVITRLAGLRNARERKKKRKEKLFHQIMIAQRCKDREGRF